jgi:superfamily II DNA or RNA helicase
MSFKDKLIRTIEELPSGDIYYMAPPEYVKRGFDYYRRGMVMDIRWGSDLLNLKVYGTRLYDVIVRFNDADEIRFSCDCPAFTTRTLCKHVICSVITLKNLIDPELFKSQSPETEKRRALLSLFNEKGVHAGLSTESVAIEIQDRPLSLIIDPDADAIFYLEYTGEKGHDYSILPVRNHKYLDLKRRLVSGDYTINDLKDIDIPVIYRDKEDRILRFDSNLRYKTYTEVVINARKTTISKKVICTKKKAGEAVIVDRMIIHPDTGLLGMVTDTSGWAFFHKVFPFYHDGRVSFTTFSELEIQGEHEIYENVVFISKGKQIEPETIELLPVIKVRIERGFDSKQVSVMPVLMKYDREESIYQPLMDFFDFVVKGRTRALRKIQSRRLVVERLFQLRQTMSAEQRGSIVDDLMRKIECNREDRHYLMHHIKGYFIEEHKDINNIVIERGRLFSYNLNIDKQVGLLEALYRCFGEHIFNGFDYNSLYIPLEEFEQRLGRLYEITRQMGIDVFVQGRPIRVSKWDISIELNRDIDWFELHPEIKVNGRDVSDKVWKAIVEGKNYYFISNDAIEVMDLETVEKLKALSMRLGLQRRQKKNEVVRVPRLQVLDWLDLRRNGVKVKLPPEDERIINSLLNFRQISPMQLPAGLKVHLRDYQQDGYNWLCFLYEHRLGACLADDMGLGKTLQAISLLAAVKEGLLQGAPDDNPPHLIVVPPSLLFNWESELKRFYPEIKVYQCTGHERRHDFDGYDVVLTSYGIVRNDISILEQRRFNIIVFDEAQAIKNIQADTTGAVRRLKGHMKIALTGTPIENHLGEYYSIIDLVLPGLLGEHSDFKRHINREDDSIINMIIKRTAPFVLRRTKEEVLKELPPKEEIDIYLELTGEQKLLYEKTVQAVRREVDEAYRDRPISQAGIIAIAALLKLRQICLSPALLSRDLPSHSPKIDLLVERLHTLLEENHGAIVFSQFTSFLDIVEDRFKNEGIHYVRLDGSTPVKARKAIVKRFQEDKDVNIFLLSLKAGGQGLNLTRATYVFHLDPWWNPAVESQATDRSHRIGQKRKVTVLRFLMRHTIEEKIMLLKKKKKALYDAVLGSGVSSRGVKITREDMKFLLGG